MPDPFLKNQGRVFLVQDAAGMEQLYRGGLERQGVAYPTGVLP
jgi:hypothetical protein